jgi:hypothetical protein
MQKLDVAGLESGANRVLKSCKPFVFGAKHCSSRAKDCFFGTKENVFETKENVFAAKDYSSGIKDCSFVYKKLHL